MLRSSGAGTSKIKFVKKSDNPLSPGLQNGVSSSMVKQKRDGGSSDADGDIYVKTKRIEVSYGQEGEEKNEKDVMIRKFKKFDIHIGTFPSTHKYDDLPEHWKYLKNCMPLQHSPYRSPSELIIVEKYSNVAIGFNLFLTKKPIVIFRECCMNFKRLSVGDVITAGLQKMYVHMDKPTIILTDMHGVNTDIGRYQFHQYESTIERGLLKLVNVTLQAKNIHQVNDRHVMFADFGTIVIPRKLCKIFKMEGFSNTIIIGSIRYCLTFIAEQQAACWKLGYDFNIYKDTVLYGCCINGKLEMVEKEEKKRRVFINTGSKVLRIVEIDFEKKKKVAPVTRLWSFMKSKHGFIKFEPGKKRTVVRKF